MVPGEKVRGVRLLVQSYEVRVTVTMFNLWLLVCCDLAQDTLLWEGVHFACTAFTYLLCTGTRRLRQLSQIEYGQADHLHRQNLCGCGGQLVGWRFSL